MVGFDVRGFGRSVAAVPMPSPEGWLLTGAHRPESSVLRGAVCDYVLGVPTFGWVEGRRLLVEHGSGAEIATFLDRHPQYPEDDLRTVLSYFDSALLAPAVRCPTVVGLGRVDRVVPSACVQAIVERLTSPLEVMTFPVGHAEGPAMRAWDRFDERWLALAHCGVPPGFGVRPAPSPPAPTRGSAVSGRR